MFQQFYQPHPALKGFVNNIMIDQIHFDANAKRLILPFKMHELNEL